MAATAAFFCDDVSVRYGSMLAVDGLSLHVEAGEIVGLLGPNGSGKSSTLAVAAGILEPSTGVVQIQGLSRSRFPLEYARRVGLVPQEPALYDELTAEQNLRFFGQLYQLRRAELAEQVDWCLNVAKLTERRHDRVDTFSGGMKQRLNLACALLHRPAVLLLDEPTAALDPASRDSLFHTLHELREQGHAILLTTHHLDEAEHGCDRIAVLDRGKIVAYGKPADLTRNLVGGRAVMYAHLRERLPNFFVKSLRRRIGKDVLLEVTGRRLRLSAPTQQRLGQALAIVLADGIILETFRTPPGRLESLLRGQAVEPPSTTVQQPELAEPPPLTPGE